MFSSSKKTLTISIRLTQYLRHEFFPDIINNLLPTVIYFWDSAAGEPGDEFEILHSEDYPGGDHIQTFFVDVSECCVPDAPSDVPVTILFHEGRKLDTADGEDFGKFFELLERAAALL